MKSNDQTIGGYCMDALAMALHIAYTYEGYKNALSKAVNIGGDCNTIAAIVG